MDQDQRCNDCGRLDYPTAKNVLGFSENANGWICPLCKFTNPYHVSNVYGFDVDEYSVRAHALAIYPKDSDYCYLKLAGKAGEVCEKRGKQIRDNVYAATIVEWKLALAKELGDVIWYVNEIALAQGFTLSEILSINLDKLEGRAARGTLKGSGDNR